MTDAAGPAAIPTGEVVELLQVLIRNECVNDGTAGSGHEHRSVTTLADYLGRAGDVVEPSPGRQSVVYRIPGRDPAAPALMLLPHLDVVPAGSHGWTHDPFSAEIVDGFVWGRGAIDMLNVTAAMAAVFRRYLEEERPALPGDLVLAAVADEEAGGVLGAGWLAEHEADLVACDYVLTEIATPHLHRGEGGGLPVTVAEKGPQWQQLSTQGVPGHASQPYGIVNAVVPLAEAITRLVAQPTPVEISADWVRFISGSGLPADLVADLTDPDRVDGAVETLREIDAGLARWAHACTHLTLAPTVLDAGVKSNVIAEFATAQVDVRIVPGQDETTVEDHFRKVLGPDLVEEVEVAPQTVFRPTASPAEGPLWDAIGDAAQELTGSRSLLPMLIPVATDARFFRDKGAVAYGVGLFDDRMTFGDMLQLFHGHDERVSIGSVELTTATLDLTLQRFGERVGVHG